MTTAPLPEAAEASRLTDALSRAGVIGDNFEVCDVTVENSRATILSRITRLRLAYNPSDVDAPKSIILKTGLPERAERGLAGARQEIAFYTQIASGMTARLTPRCFEAQCDDETKHWHLVLEDLTDTHFVVSPWPLPPTIEQCERMVEARARFHAAWWDDLRLGVSIGTWADRSTYTRLLLASYGCDDAIMPSLASFML